jgi:hypothetical protein
MQSVRGMVLMFCFIVLYMCYMFLSSLSAIAKQRPAFYGRILPVLLGLDPSSSVINGMHVSAAKHALKSAFLNCLKCTHPGAAPVFFFILNTYLMFLRYHTSYPLSIYLGLQSTCLCWDWI